jgi:hypothetical protein
MNLQIKEYLITEFEKLPQSKQEEVIDFIDFLNSKKEKLSINEIFQSQSMLIEEESLDEAKKKIIIKKMEEASFRGFYAQHKFDSSDLKFNREEMNER